MTQRRNGATPHLRYGHGHWHVHCGTWTGIYPTFEAACQIAQEFA